MYTAYIGLAVDLVFIAKQLALSEWLCLAGRADWERAWTTSTDNTRVKSTHKICSASLAVGVLFSAAAVHVTPACKKPNRRLA